MTPDVQSRARGGITIAAGGTGGHLFPAFALAQELARRGRAIDLMTDGRGERYDARFPSSNIHRIASGSMALRRPLQSIVAAARLAAGTFHARRILAASRPAAVVGFGGYPSIPPLLAAALTRTPICIHEQNAVMGRANRLLALFAKAVALSFPDTKAVPGAVMKRLVVTGNPARDAVIAAAKKDYPQIPKKGLDLLVFGGSQGARVMSDIVPAAMSQLPASVRQGLKVVQQARKEDMARVAKAYETAGIKAEVADFFDDLPARIAGSHLVIARAGASSIAELGIIGRPAILVPLPGAIDDDQLNNARAFSSAGAGWVVDQSEFTAERLAGLITRLRFDPAGLAEAAARARSFGRGDAVIQLADVVEGLADGATDDAEEVPR